MRIYIGSGKTEFGPGIDIFLTGEEVATAISEYVASRNVIINGPRTVRVNEQLCEGSRVYVDPSGFVEIKGTE